jgi:hypothetical protein
MAKILIAATALALAACTTTPAAENIGGMKAKAASYGLQCPKADPLVTYGSVSEASAQWPSAAFPGGVIKMPLRYADPKWASGPHGHNRMAHEVAHTCGADERTARSVANAWWPVGAEFNGGLSD